MSKPARPYSHYNIFFQLEREYILQVELGFQPDYDCSEIFDPFDTTNYHGPPLPLKYSNLIHLNDWHLPGKEKRRKRRHRRTHGKIDFHELSLRIAASWKSVDPETRTFCSQLGNIGLLQYTREMRAYKLMNRRDCKAKSSRAEKKLKEKKAETTLDKLDDLDLHVTVRHNMPSQIQIPQISSDKFDFIPTEKCTTEQVNFASDKGVAHRFRELVTLEPVRRFVSNITESLEQETDHSLVDLDDDAMIGVSSDGLCFVPTERCTMEDVDAAFDKDILHMLPELVKPCPSGRYINDTASLDKGNLSVAAVDGGINGVKKSETVDVETK
eukprot:CCRYP_001549-RA/>CCRYP_001549-RA protein AED:0.31 eAED:0.31 QI:0/-1/0/1/-1/1/1/0/326